MRESLLFQSASSKKSEGGSKFGCIFSWDSLYTIFGHGGCLKRSKEAVCLMMEKDECLHAPHDLTSTKQSQSPERGT